MQRVRELFWVINGLILVTLLVWATDLDRSLAALFFLGENPLVAMRWHGLTHPLWRTIYAVTNWPALLLSFASVAVLVRGLRDPRYRPWRRPALFVVLLLVLGAGLVVNVLLKDTLGKPRPAEITDFGGSYQYAQFWEPGTGKRNGSFPSGHAAIAFVVIGPWFFLRDRQRRAARGFLVAGIGWGALVGLTRMAQGGHFFSDVIWSGALMYLVGGTLALCFSFERTSPEEPLPILCRFGRCALAAEPTVSPGRDAVSPLPPFQGSAEA